MFYNTKGEGAREKKAIYWVSWPRELTQIAHGSVWGWPEHTPLCRSISVTEWSVHLSRRHNMWVCKWDHVRNASYLLNSMPQQKYCRRFYPVFGTASSLHDSDAYHNPRPRLQFCHPRTHLGGYYQFIYSLIAIELRDKRTESLGFSESNPTRFYYLRSHYDLSRVRQGKKCSFFSNIIVFCK